MNPWSLMMKPLRDRPGVARRKEPKPAPCEKQRPVLTLVSVRPPEKTMDEGVVKLAHTNMPLDPWGLTHRQREILDLCVQGMDRAAIAEKLAISLSTTSQHLAEVRLKLDVRTTAQAVVEWHRFYRVVGPRPADFDKDDMLIAKLQRATQALRATKGEDQS